MIHCATCGSYILFIRKRGVHVYGHCGSCERAGRLSLWVKESDILTQIHQQLLTLRMAPELWLAVDRALAEEEERDRGGVAGLLRSEQSRRLYLVRESLSRLVDIFLSGDLGRSEYEVRLKVLKGEESALAASLEREGGDRESPYRKLRLLIAVAQRAADWFRQGSDEEKRRLLCSLAVGTELQGRRVIMRWRFPLDTVYGWGRNKNRPNPGELGLLKNGRARLPTGEQLISDGSWSETVAHLDLILFLISAHDTIVLPADIAA